MTNQEKKKEFKIWTEKYRPKTFDEIIGQEEIISKVKSLVEKKEMPHVLFSGPAGIGKTTTSYVIARTMYGELWQDNILELNASDERGIDVIRNKIKEFARAKKSDNIPFKIIYLDECDALTTQAQQALRRIMEKYVSETRFILSCNYLSKIIDPIQSRCAVFKFKGLEKEDMLKVLSNIEKTENINISDEAKNALITLAKGDLRKLENTIQSCSTLSKDVSADLVYSMTAMAKPEEIEELISIFISKNYFSSLNKFIEIQEKYSLSLIDLIKEIQSSLDNSKIADNEKIKIIKECANTEMNLVFGCDEEIQLRGFIAKIVM
jgi:replication factor C small subunit